MQMNVAQQLKAAVGAVRDYEVNEVVDITGSGHESLVQGEVTLIRTDRGILVKGELHTEIEMTCCRCLSLFKCPLNINIVEEFFPTVNIITGALTPLPDEPGCFTINGQHVLDLTEALRQYALLFIPMKPLCRPDCAGLCPSCGHNLNRGPCHCPAQVADPRWSELSKVASTGERKSK